MKRGKEILVILALFLFLLAPFRVSSEDKKIDSEVYKQLDDKGEANVIVKTMEKEGFLFFGEEKEKIYGLKINKKEMEKLENDKNVEEISLSPKISAFLQDSISIVNATVTWQIKMNSINITGIDETICIVDTAVNFSHPDLQGRNLTCVIDCYNKECIEDCSLTDDNGHGTHIAGIAAASGRIEGIAKQAGLISLKVLDENGDAHPQNGTINLRDAIQWCVQNRDIYNISVISLSLGTNTLYNDYCDSIFSSTLTKAINNATFYNVSVITATGNQGSVTSIASPACIQNSTSVGAVRKDDVIVYNRNNLTDLIAPGYLINSTRGYSGGCLTGCSCYGEYMTCSGTSMAAPQVSGAFALVRQYLRLQNSKEPKHYEIQNSLNNTGTIINDPYSGLNFSRIDIYSAVSSLDSSNPEVNLISPENQSSHFNQNVTFVCSANDAKLSNITLHIWNSSGLHNNTEYRNFDGVNGIAEFNISEIPRDDYKWNCLANDKDSRHSFAESNYTLKIDYNLVILNHPIGNSYVNDNQTFECSAETDSFKTLSNLTFFITNHSRIYNETINISGFTNSSIFYYNFTDEGEYEWGCFVYNNHSEFSFSISNYTINYDLTSPEISLINPLNSALYTGSQQIDFEFNVSEDLISNCSLLLNGAVSITNYSVNSSITLKFSDILIPGEYSWQVKCTDLAGNEGESSIYSLKINSDAITSLDSGGGTPAKLPEKTYILNEEQVSSGYNSQLGENDKIVFYLKNGMHTLTAKSISAKYAIFLIESAPVKINLTVGEERFFDLTNDRIYDLYLSLNSINNNKANLTIKIIEEKIPEIEKETEEEDVQIVAFEKQEEDNLNTLNTLGNRILVTALTTIAVLVIIYMFIRKKDEKTKTKSQRKKALPSTTRRRRR